MAEMSSGEIARSRREELGLTREQLARTADVSTSTVTRLELNDHLPGPASLLRLARALDVSIERVIDSSTIANPASTASRAS